MYIAFCVSLSSITKSHYNNKKSHHKRLFHSMFSLFVEVINCNSSQLFRIDQSASFTDKLHCFKCRTTPFDEVNILRTLTKVHCNKFYCPDFLPGNFLELDSSIDGERRQRLSVFSVENIHRAACRITRS